MRAVIEVVIFTDQLSITIVEWTFIRPEKKKKDFKIIILLLLKKFC